MNRDIDRSIARQKFQAGILLVLSWAILVAVVAAILVGVIK